MQYDLVDIEQTDLLWQKSDPVQGRGQERIDDKRENSTEMEVSIILIMVMVSKM